MEKTPRYTQRERNMVLGYAAQYKDVIENKRTDAESNRKKDEVWLQIAKEFNSKVYHQRSAKQLRQLYKNMKLLLKKDLCGEDKGNRSFMDLLNTLSQQESVAQYIAEQMSPEGAGSQATANGRHLAEDYEDSKLPMYEGMDTEVIMIKSETISDNEQTENGMDCMDEDDDDDCPIPKAPEVCLEEEDDEVLFAADLRQLQQQYAATGSLISANNNNNNNNSSNNNNNNNNNNSVCSTKTSISSTGSNLSGGAPKAKIMISNVGNIRVGAFASISKTLQNGSANSSSCNGNNNNNSHNKNNNNNNSYNNNNNNNSSCSSNNSNGQLTPEQMQQHLLLNGLGLSAVQHPSSHSLQASISATTSLLDSSRLQLPRMARAHNASTSATTSTATTAAVDAGAAATTAAAATVAAAAAAAAAAAITNSSNNNNNSSSNNNNNNNNAGGVQLLLNGREKPHLQLQPSSSCLSIAGDTFNGYNGLGVASIHNTNASNSNNNANNNNNSNSNNNNNNNSSSILNNLSNNSPHGQHNEYILSLALEERQRKIELLNAQIEYWKTLTKKLNSHPGHYPNPACLCHFPGSGGLAAVGVAAGGASTATVNALQTQSSSS
ncbi:GH24878 [Drosophila grimshawi]|uniref:Regulatory protein zeste n=1 Tax=Drosophila grimshawi TaxID=7222 RepID=B4JNS9_DROGR|nr:GH24878 [Drosophila grimshawi]